MVFASWLRTVRSELRLGRRASRPRDRRRDFGPAAFAAAVERLEDRTLLSANAIELASVTSGGASPNGSSRSESISDDGRYVAFESSATNVVAGATSATNRIYLRDRTIPAGSAGSVVLASTDATGTALGGNSTKPHLSGDGRFLLFVNKSATGRFNPSSGQTVYDSQLYLKNLQTNAVTVLTTPPVPNQAGQYSPSALPNAPYYDYVSCTDAAISGDGSVAAFEVSFYKWDGSQFVPTRQVYTYSAGGWAQFVPNGANSSTDLDVTGLALDQTGSRLAFSTTVALTDAGGTTDGNGVSDVYLADLSDLAAGSVALVSQTGTAAGNGASTNATLSRDGSRVAYESLATNLVASDGNGKSDVFLFDATAAPAAATALLSRTSSAASNGTSILAAISPDGRYIAFVGNATTLAAGTTAVYHVYLADTATGGVRLIDYQADGTTVGTTAASATTAPAVASDAAIVAFASADNLTASATSSSQKIYAYAAPNTPPTFAPPAAVTTDQDDPVFGAVSAIDADADPLTYSVTTAPAHGTVQLAADGSFRYLPAAGYFGSDALEIGVSDGRGGSDTATVNVTVNPVVFNTNGIMLVSATVDGTAPSPSSSAPAISADGRYVAFLSNAYDLIPGGYYGPTPQVYLRDRRTGTTTLVSADAGGTPADANSTLVRLASGGAALLFATGAGNLGETDGLANSQRLYRKDRSAGTVVELTAGLAATVSGTTRLVVTDAAISGDGQVATFKVEFYGSNGALLARRVYFRGLGAGGGSQLIGPGESVNYDNVDFADLALSDDGNILTFRSALALDPDADTNGRSDVYYYDRQNADNSRPFHRASVANGGSQANEGFTFNGDGPAISGDGRFVAFTSYADNLVAGDANGKGDVFVRDLSAGTTVRVSVATDGTESDGLSHVAAISPDGRYVAFASSATNLTGTTLSAKSRLYLYDRDIGRVRLLDRLPGGDPSAGQTSYGGRIAVDDAGEVAFVSPEALTPAASGAYQVYLWSDRPFALNDAATTRYDQPVTLAVLPNDLDPAAAGLTLVETSSPDAVVNGDGSITYTPPASFASLAPGATATATFTYVVRDANGRTDPGGTVTVTVRGPNAAPTPDGSGTLPVVRGSGVAVTSAMLHATDPDNTPAELIYTVTSGPAHGRLELVAAQGTPITSFTQADVDAGRLRYVHNGDAGTADAFGYSLSDGAASVTGSVSVAVADRAGLSLLTRGADVGPADGNSFGPSVSGDGRYVAFVSDATNLTAVAPPDRGSGESVGRYVYVLDRQTGLVRLGDAAGDGTPANASPGLAAISGDGRYLFFTTAATNLSPVPDGLNPGTDGVLYRKDLTTGEVVTVSQGDEARPAGEGVSRLSVFSLSPSRDGSRVLAGVYGGDDGGGITSLYLYDLTAGTRTLVLQGANASGDGPTGVAFDRPRLSGDGSFAVFETRSKLDAADTDLLTDVYRYDVVAGTFLFLGEAGAETFDATISGDGRFVAYADRPNSGRYQAIFVRDVDAGTTVQADLPTDGNFDGNSSSDPRISPDGRFVAFTTDAADFIGDAAFGPDRGPRIFLRDLMTGETQLVSRNVDGSLAPAPDEGGGAFALSDRAGVVVFEHQANLDPVVVNGAVDLFAYERTRLLARPDAADATDGGGVTVDVLANDADPRGGGLTVTVVSATGGATVDAQGRIVYSPGAAFRHLKAGETATDVVTYRIADATGDFADGTLTVIVTGVNDAPTAAGGEFSVGEDGSLSDTLAGLAADVDGDPLTFTEVGGPTPGLTLNANGTFTFVPPASFQSLGAGMSQDVTFTFRASDGSLSADALVTVTVTGANDAPTASAGVFSIGEDGSLSGNLAGLASDVDGDPLTFTEVGGPTSGLTLNADGRFVFVPPASFQSLGAGMSQDVTFTFRASDGSLSADALVTVKVTGANDAPVTAPDRIVLFEGTAGTLDVLANDSDADGDALTARSVTGLAALGGATLAADGTFVIDAAASRAAAAGLRPGEQKSFAVSYTADDGHGGTAVGAVTVVVVGRPALAVTGAGSGGGPHVKIADARTGADLASFFAFDPAFDGGVAVAVGDVTGDGFDDVVVAAGSGGGPHVKVLDGLTFTVVREFFAYDAAFNGGVAVAVGDVDGDGYADVITGAGSGGGPHVEVFSGRTGERLRSFFAYDAAFNGGVAVAAGDVDGDGFADVVTGAGSGGGPHVEVFSGRTGERLRSFFAYDPAFGGGVSVAAGDVDGDGYADVVTGAGAGGGPHVEAFSGRTGLPIRSFFAYDAAFTGGVHIGIGDLNADGYAEIVTGAGPGGSPHVETFDGRTGALLRSVFAYDADFRGGVLVASAGGGAAGLLPSGAGAAAAGFTPLRATASAAGPAPAALTATAAAEQLRQAVGRLSAAGLPAASAATLRGTPIVIGPLAGRDVAAYAAVRGTGTLFLDATAAGFGWQSGPGLRDDLYPGGTATGAAVGREDLLTALGYALGRELGAGPVVTGGGTLADDLLPAGLRRLLDGEDLQALYGSDPSGWMLS